jgi:pyruvate ferredoxin oxidoreductase delta subunit
LKDKAAVSRPCKGASGLTGTWRLKKPIIENSKCTKCLLCWLYCGEGAILRTKDNEISIDYDYCKGCGVCAEVCPAKAITMIKEE